MTFLNPLILFGLAAAAVPLVLHLLNLRKLPVIEFSTLDFLKELQQTKIRRLKLRQLLLLIVRTLFIILVILGFARPALRGGLLANLGSEANSTIAIILDDSFSMQASDEHGEYFKQAREGAQKIVDVAKNGDEIILIKLSDLPKATISPATHNFELVRNAIKEARISEIRRSLEDALDVASAAMRQATNVNKEIYVISDMQQTLFQRARSKVQEKFDEKAKVYLLPIGTKDVANTGIDSVQVKTTILEKERPATVYVSVRNFGAVPMNNSVVSVYLDGVKAAQSNISAAAFGSGSLELAVVPKRSGFIAGRVSLEDDAIVADNNRYFTMYIPERIDVAILGADDAANKFTMLALNSRGGENTQTLLSIKQAPDERFWDLDLRRVDILICTNVRSFPTGAVDRIKTFVEGGGGLVIFPGTEVTAYNTGLLPALKIPPIEGVAAIQADGTTFKNVDLEHPLFSSIFEEQAFGKRGTPRVVESPVIHQVIHRKTGIRGQAIITLGEGTPFLTEQPAGSGRVLFYSVPPTLSWSDFPLKGIFAPLLYRSMVYLSPREHTRQTYLTGTQATIVLPGTAGGAAKKYSLREPDDVEQTLYPSSSDTKGGAMSSTLSITSEPFRTAGIYRLRADRQEVEDLAVNTDSRESDTRRIGPDELQKYFGELGVAHYSQLGAGDKFGDAIMQSRYGVELWRPCIILAIAMALLEMAIARDSRGAAEAA